MFKKTFSIVVLIIFAVTTLVGCGGGDNASQESSKEGTENKPQKVYELKLGHNVTPESEVDLGAKKFAELVEQKTNGQVKVTVFPAAQLGSEIDMVKNMGLGAIDIVIPGDGAFGTYVPDFQPLVLPFLFNDVEHMTKVYNGEIGKEMDAAFRKSANSTILAVWHRGARHLTANKAIPSPAELKGLDLRVTTIPIIISAWKALGANPTPIPFPELFISLQQGVVDAQENPLDLIYTSNFHEVQSHVMLTGHTYSPWLFMMNTNKYESLPDDIRAKFDEALAEATEYQHKLVAESEANYLQKLKDKGMEVIEVDRQLFMKKYAESGVEQELTKDFPKLPELVKKVKEATN